jgi:hypothetical protein
MFFAVCGDNFSFCLHLYVRYESNLIDKHCDMVRSRSWNTHKRIRSYLETEPATLLIKSATSLGCEP